jgi:hypothetical protein
MLSDVKEPLSFVSSWLQVFGCGIAHAVKSAMHDLLMTLINDLSAVLPAR